MDLIYIVEIIVILMLIYGILIMPRMFHKPDITPFQNRYYAHRGLHNNASKEPENSLRAFELAVENGYGIELDIQLTKDEIPVVFHDYNLMRVCGVDKKVHECTYKELQEYRLYSSSEGIPQLKEVLSLVDGKVPLIVELKVPWKVNRICEKTYELLKGYRGTYCIESFHPFVLVWFKKHYPRILRGQLSTDFFKDKEKGNPFYFFVLKYLLLNVIAKPDFIAYHHIHYKNISFRIVARFYKAYTFAWTIKSQSELEKAKDNFEYFIFDSFTPR